MNRDADPSQRETSELLKPLGYATGQFGKNHLVEEGTDHILGAHLLGPQADEVINLFALAIRLRVPAAELRQVIFAYPTNGSDVRFML